MKFTIHKGEYYISAQDLADYLASKHSRDHCKINGEPVFDSKKKELSVEQAARWIGVEAWHLRNLVRQGKIHSVRKGWSYVLKEKDVMAFLESQKNSQQLSFA